MSDNDLIIPGKRQRDIELQQPESSEAFTQPVDTQPQSKKKKPVSESAQLVLQARAKLTQYIKVLDIHSAIDEVKGLINMLVKPPAYIYGLLMSIASRTTTLPPNVLTDILDVISYMKKQDIVLPEAVLSSTVRLLCVNDRPDDAEEMIQHMISQNADLRHRTFSVLATAYGRKGRLSDMERIVSLMVERGVTPSLAMLRNYIALCAQAGDGSRCLPAIQRLSLVYNHVPDDIAQMIVELFRRTPEITRKYSVASIAVDRVTGRHNFLPAGQLSSVNIDDATRRIIADRVLEANSAYSATFSHFGAWLQQNGPYDVIIDGANVGWFGQSSSNSGVRYSQVEAIRAFYEARGLRPLIIFHYRWIQHALGSKPSQHIADHSSGSSTTQKQSKKIKADGKNEEKQGIFGDSRPRSRSGSPQRSDGNSSPGGRSRHYSTSSSGSESSAGSQISESGSCSDRSGEESEEIEESPKGGIYQSSKSKFVFFSSPPGRSMSSKAPQNGKSSSNSNNNNNKESEEITATPLFLQPKSIAANATVRSSVLRLLEDLPFHSVKPSRASITAMAADPPSPEEIQTTITSLDSVRTAAQLMSSVLPPAAPFEDDPLLRLSELVHRQDQLDAAVLEPLAVVLEGAAEMALRAAAEGVQRAAESCIKARLKVPPANFRKANQLSQTAESSVDSNEEGEVRNGPKSTWPPTDIGIVKIMQPQLNDLSTPLNYPYLATASANITNNRSGSLEVEVPSQRIENIVAAARVPSTRSGANTSNAVGPLIELDIPVSTSPTTSTSTKTQSAQFVMDSHFSDALLYLSTELLADCPTNVPVLPLPLLCRLLDLSFLNEIRSSSQGEALKDIKLPPFIKRALELYGAPNRHSTAPVDARGKARALKVLLESSSGDSTPNTNIRYLDLAKLRSSDRSDRELDGVSKHNASSIDSRNSRTELGYTWNKEWKITPRDYMEYILSTNKHQYPDLANKLAPLRPTPAASAAAPEKKRSTQAPGGTGFGAIMPGPVLEPILPEMTAELFVRRRLLEMGHISLELPASDDLEPSSACKLLEERLESVDLGSLSIPDSVLAQLYFEIMVRNVAFVSGAQHVYNASLAAVAGRSWLHEKWRPAMRDLSPSTTINSSSTAKNRVSVDGKDSIPTGSVSNNEKNGGKGGKTIPEPVAVAPHEFVRGRTSLSPAFLLPLVESPQASQSSNSSPPRAKHLSPSLGASKDSAPAVFRPFATSSFSPFSPSSFIRQNLANLTAAETLSASLPTAPRGEHIDSRPVNSVSADNATSSVDRLRSSGSPLSQTGVIESETTVLASVAADRDLGAALVPLWSERNQIYTTPSGVNDDHMWLYAAMTLSTTYSLKFVSNDLLRDHLFETVRSNGLRLWQERHQVFYEFDKSWSGRVQYMAMLEDATNPSTTAIAVEKDRKDGPKSSSTTPIYDVFLMNSDGTRKAINANLSSRIVRPATIPSFVRNQFLLSKKGSSSGSNSSSSSPNRGIQPPSYKKKSVSSGVLLSEVSMDRPFFRVSTPISRFAVDLKRALKAPVAFAEPADGVDSSEIQSASDNIRQKDKIQDEERAALRKQLADKLRSSEESLDYVRLRREETHASHANIQNLLTSYRKALERESTLLGKQRSLLNALRPLLDGVKRHSTRVRRKRKAMMLEGTAEEKLDSEEMKTQEQHDSSVENKEEGEEVEEEETESEKSVKHVLRSAELRLVEAIARSEIAIESGRKQISWLEGAESRELQSYLNANNRVNELEHLVSGAREILKPVLSFLFPGSTTNSQKEPTAAQYRTLLQSLNALFSRAGGNAGDPTAVRAPRQERTQNSADSADSQFPDTTLSSDSKATDAVKLVSYYPSTHSAFTSSSQPSESSENDFLGTNMPSYDVLGPALRVTSPHSASKTLKAEKAGSNVENDPLSDVRISLPNPSIANATPGWSYGSNAVLRLAEPLPFSNRTQTLCLADCPGFSSDSDSRKEDEEFMTKPRVFFIPYESGLVSRDDPDKAEWLIIWENEFEQNFQIQKQNTLPWRDIVDPDKVPGLFDIVEDDRPEEDDRDVKMKAKLK